MSPSPRIAVLIVAAGTGVRAGGALPKQYQLLHGRPLLCHSTQAFLSHPAIAAVQVVIHPEHHALYDGAAHSVVPSPLRGGLGRGDTNSPRPDRSPPPQPSPQGGGSTEQASLPGALLLPPVHGGAQRSDSVRSGLAALEALAPDYVLIHDAARPFISHAVIDRILAALTANTGVVPALPVHDTVRRYQGDAWQEVPREGLLRIQTPQAFPFEHVLKIAASPPTQPSPARGEGFPAPPATLTDDAAVWLAAGKKLVYTLGDERLRKVTTAEDMAWAEQNTARRTAVGTGFDVHALVPSGDSGVIRIGGIDIPSAYKLDGHSDADVALHALVDALLGTIAEGDIGQHFPPNDARWKGADSSVFVTETVKKVAARGGNIQHIDLTLICETPKLSPHREAIRNRIAELLGLPLGYISVKATTTERLGFTGRGEGIAAQAVATVHLPEGV